MSTSPMSCKDRFYNLLEDVFIGVPVEGQSGYINLMRIKQQYYRKVMIPHLESYVAEQLQNFPHFQEEMYDKLYTFFRRYFSENGSLGLFFTPYHESVYERVYTDDRDVMLFYKTHRLYYVKTDRLFRNMDVEVDGYTFRFDVSGMEHKKANEKRELAYHLDKNDQGNVILLRVSYKEGNSKTDIQGICKRLKQERGMKVSEETLEKAISKFERQSEMDYFICKDARSFLREQFDLWMWQYLLGQPNEEPVDVFTQHRLDQLQALKRVAYYIIDFIAAFEDELVKIWNKPRFVLNSNYVITIDRIWDKSPHMVHRLLNHSGMEKQVQEWRELGMVGDDFQPQQILNSGNLIDKLHPRYRFLPVDTKYFKDIELDILGLFDNLDEELDGWLIKSENYQALNTILPKFRGKVKCIYIDPPYNTGEDGFLYVDRFCHSSWLSMMSNRFELARKILSPDGVIFVSIGDLNPQEGESYRLQQLMSSIFPRRLGTLIWRKRGGIGSFSERDMTENHEYVLVYGNEEVFLYNSLLSKDALKDYINEDERGKYRWMDLIGPSQQTKDKRPNLNYNILVDSRDMSIVGFEYISSEGAGTEVELKKPCPKQHIVSIQPPGKFTWLISRDKMWEHYQNGLIRVTGSSIDQLRPQIKKYLYRPDGTVDGNLIKSILTDNGYPVGTNAEASKELANICPNAPVNDIKPKPVSLIELLLRVSTSRDDWVLDYFSGSGTTIHATISLSSSTGVRRRFIAVEMGNHFENVILPRVKRLAYCLSWEEGKPNVDKASGYSMFVTYFQLEQFEQTLANALMREDVPSIPSEGVFDYDPCMLHRLSLKETDHGYFLEHADANIAMTIALANGLPIRRISAEGVVYDGDLIRWDAIPAYLIKRVVWWR
jgi:adenine-specific DNA-methyltransferase